MYVYSPKKRTTCRARRKAASMSSGRIQKQDTKQEGSAALAQRFLPVFCHQNIAGSAPPPCIHPAEGTVIRKKRKKRSRHRGVLLSVSARLRRSNDCAGTFPVQETDRGVFPSPGLCGTHSVCAVAMHSAQAGSGTLQTSTHPFAREQASSSSSRSSNALLLLPAAGKTVS